MARLADIAAEKSALIQAALDEARERFPDSPVTREVFEEFLGDRLDAEADEAGVSALHLVDLVLTCAALSGQETAIARIESAVRDEVARTLATASPVLLDEIAQTLIVRLLAPLDGSSARLEQFAGRASLRGWLRVIAVREFQAQSRHQSGEGADLDLEHLPSLLREASLEVDHARYHDVFKRAFQDCLASLSIHARTMLRQHYREAIPIAHIAKLRNVHRDTVARELAQIRASLQNAVARRLREELGMSEAELRELALGLGSQIELSLSRLFGRDG